MSRKLSAYWSKKSLTRFHVNAFAKKVMHYLKPRMRVLDLGSGYGQDSFYFARLGMKVTAVDFSKTSLDFLRKTAEQKGFTIDVHRNDISKRLPFKNNSFDAVYAHLSIHYFDDRTTQRIIAEIKRILKPRGLLFVKCKSVDDPLYGKGKKVGADMFLHQHIRRFFRKEFMQSLLKDWNVVSLRRTSSTYVDYKSCFIEAIARKS